MDSIDRLDGVPVARPVPLESIPLDRLRAFGAVAVGFGAVAEALTAVAVDALYPVESLVHVARPFAARRPGGGAAAGGPTPAWARPPAGSGTRSPASPAEAPPARAE